MQNEPKRVSMPIAACGRLRSSNETNKTKKHNETLWGCQIHNAMISVPSQSTRAWVASMAEAERMPLCGEPASSIGLEFHLPKKQEDDQLRF